MRRKSEKSRERGAKCYFISYFCGRKNVVEISRCSKLIDTLFVSIFSSTYLCEEGRSVASYTTDEQRRDGGKGKQRWCQSRGYLTQKIVTINFEHLLREK